ncbi:MAG: hypothetical protein ABW352_19150 [Polyangiales bacterium]
MQFARASWLSIALWSAVGSLASSALAQTQPAPPQPAPPQPAPADPAPAPDSFTPPASPLVAPAPEPAPPAGYPSAPPVYYAPGYAPAYGPAQAPPGYYGIEAAPAEYSQPTYQALQGRQPGPGSHEHEGFYLHLGTGIGAGGASYKERIGGNVSSVRTRGIALTFDVGIGGRVVENFILHGNLTLTFYDVNKKVDGVEDNGYDAINSTLWMIGAGGTYYVMPHNLYFTLVLGTGGFTESRDYETFGLREVQINSSAGFASSLAIGKEWWVGRGEWGIGAAIKGMLAVSPISISNFDTTVTGHSVTLEFSATLN